jgi:hypothetical protein
MVRSVVARLALAVAALLGAAAVAGIAWAVQYPYNDITAAYVEMLTVIAAVAALAAFGVFRHYAGRGKAD